MNLKILLSLIISCLLFNLSIAQKQHFYLYKNSGEQVYTIYSADYTRIVTEPDDGTALFNVKDCYKNGKVKMIGKSSKVDVLMLEGQCMRYFPSGKKQEYANYQDGGLAGDSYTYYPNGKLYANKKYVADKINHLAGYYPNYAIISCNDSTGKAMVIDGNGYYVGYDSDFKNIIEEGNVKAGLKDGKWKGNNGNKKNLITFTEDYLNGKLVSGESVDAKNAIVKYTTESHEPSYKGGMKAFYMFLSQHIVYPENARARNIQGTVYLSFVVEKDGSLTDIEVTSSPGEELSYESVRVLKQSGKWDPGIQYGRPVRVQDTVPVTFSYYPAN